MDQTKNKAYPVYNGEFQKITVFAEGGAVSVSFNYENITLDNLVPTIGALEIMVKEGLEAAKKQTLLI